LVVPATSRTTIGIGVGIAVGTTTADPAATAIVMTAIVPTGDGREIIPFEFSLFCLLNATCRLAWVARFQAASIAIVVTAIGGISAHARLNILDC
jgi:hypothetical protein